MQVLLALIVSLALIGYVVVPIRALCSSEFGLIRFSAKSPLRFAFMLFLLCLWPMFFFARIAGGRS